MDANIVADLKLTLVADNLYIVPFEIIQKDSFEIKEKGFDFSNPRIICESFNSSPVGMNQDDMNYLKESIQRKGLLTPLLARINEGKIGLINGHRRFLAIEELVKEKAECLDLRTGQGVPAGELYANLLIRIFDNATDIDSYHLAFEEDKTKVKFGHGVEYKFVDYCIEKKIEDSKILLMTGNTQAWLDGVKGLLKKIDGTHPVDYEIRDCIFNEKMSISAAKLLADIENPEDKLTAFKDAQQAAQAEATAKIEKIDKQIKNIRKKQDIAKAQSMICAKNNDQDGVKSAEDILEEGLLAETELLSKQQSVTPIITTHNLASSNNNIGPRAGKIASKNKSEKATKSESSKEVQEGKSAIEEDKSFSKNISELAISKTTLVENWLGTIDKVADGELEGISLDSFVVEIARDLIVSILNDQSCSDFLIHWSKESRRGSKFA